MRGTDAGTGSLGDHRGPNVGEDPSLPALQAWSTQHHRANAGQDPVNQADSRERRGGMRGLGFLRGLKQLSRHSGRGEPGATALFRRPWAPPRGRSV